MKTTLNLPISASGSDVNPQAETVVNSIVKDFAKRSPLLAKAIKTSPSLKKPSSRSDDGFDGGYKIVLLGQNTPRFNWSTTRHDPDTKTIHVWTNNLNPQILEKDLGDSLVRAAFHNIAHLAYNGHDAITSDLRSLGTTGAATPLRGDFVKKQIDNLYKLKHFRISQIKKSLRDFQRAAYDEHDLHDARTRKKLTAYQKLHTEGRHSPALNAVGVKHFKLLMQHTSPHAPHALTAAKMLRVTKTPKTTRKFNELVNQLKKHLHHL